MTLVPQVLKDILDVNSMPDGTQTTEFLHLNQPRNYKFLPAQYTSQIRYSGRLTDRGHQIKDLIQSNANNWHFLFMIFKR